MANKAKLEIMGNLGANPELRFLEDGTPVATFNVAVNDRRNRAGNAEETTTWFRVTAWRRQAEIVSELLAKGMNVQVEGRFQPRVYVNNAGEQRVSYDIALASFEILTPRNVAGGEQAASAVGAGAPADADPDDADIPF